MSFLADENIPRPLVRELRAGGFDLLSVGETHGGIADRQVLRLAQETQRILITQDKDLASIAFRPQAAYVPARTGPGSTASSAKLLCASDRCGHKEKAAVSSGPSREMRWRHPDLETVRRSLP